MDVTKNVELYKAWRTGKRDIENLKNILCICQFGGKMQERKLVWILSLEGKTPIVITPSISLRYLEKKIIPGIVNPEKKKLRLQRSLDSPSYKDFYEKTKDGDSLWYILVKKRRWVPKFLS